MARPAHDAKAVFTAKGGAASEEVELTAHHDKEPDMTMADGNRPTWEYVIPVAMAVVAWHSNGILQTLATGVCGGWVAILFAWHSGWRKVNNSE